MHDRKPSAKWLNKNCQDENSEEGDNYTSSFAFMQEEENDNNMYAFPAAFKIQILSQAKK
jgi:hypothetical protein